MTTQDLLDARYGRRRTPATRWIIGAVIAVALVAVGWFGWVTVASSLTTVDADATAFDVVDSHTIVVDFQVSAPTGRDVACALEARDTDHGVVGWRVVEIPASDQHSRAFRETIPTTAEATTGLVNSCWVT